VLEGTRFARHAKTEFIQLSVGVLAPKAADSFNRRPAYHRDTSRIVINRQECKVAASLQIRVTRQSVDNAVIVRIGPVRVALDDVRNDALECPERRCQASIHQNHMRAGAWR
jgi:hypothetical protein